jgi:hypothetical protein
METIIAAYERRCELDGVDPDSELAGFLESEDDSSEFWQRVKTNLRAGRIRLVFVADEIPSELRRIIEFLNEQMNPAEALGLEVRQYLGEGSTVLVPRVVGYTAGAEQAKAVRQTRIWDRASFLEVLAENRTEREAAAALRILDWCRDRGVDVKWGTGIERGSFSPKLKRNGVTYNMMTVWNFAGEIAIQFGSMRGPPFNEIDKRRALADRLQAVPGSREFSDHSLTSAWPSMRLSGLVEADGLQAFLAVWDWYLAQVQEEHPAF